MDERRHSKTEFNFYKLPNWYLRNAQGKTPKVPNAFPFIMAYQTPKSQSPKGTLLLLLGGIQLFVIPNVSIETCPMLFSLFFRRNIVVFANVTGIVP